MVRPILQQKPAAPQAAHGLPAGCRPWSAPEHLPVCGGPCHAAASPVKVDTHARCSLCMHAALSQAVAHCLTQPSTTMPIPSEALHALICA